MDISLVNKCTPNESYRIQNLSSPSKTMFLIGKKSSSYPPPIYDYVMQSWKKLRDQVF